MYKKDCKPMDSKTGKILNPGVDSGALGYSGIENGNFMEFKS